MIRTIFLSLSLLSLFFSASKLIEYWDYQIVPTDVQQLLQQNINAEQLSKLIGDAINDDRLEDARLYMSIGKAFGYPLHYDYYQKYIDERDTDLRRLKKGISGFAEGFVSGKGADASAISGAMVSDFTVIGDARDLLDQYQKSSRGEEVNELIVGLAGVGIGLTVVTYGSAGTSAVAKSGTSVLKLAAKTGRLTRRFSDELLRISNRVFDWRLFKQSVKQSGNMKDMQRAARNAFSPAAARPLKVMAKQANSIRKNTSLVDAVEMMRYVENADDLRRLEKFTAKHQSLSKGILRLAGKAALGTVRVLRKTTELFFFLAVTIVSALFSFLGLFSFGKRKPRKA